MDVTYADPTFIAAATVVVVAIFVRTLTGFGAALILVPSLSLFWDLRQVVLLAALVQAVTGFPVALAARRQASRPALMTLLLGSLCGLVVGALLLAVVPLPWLRRGLGLATLLFGLSRFTPIGARVAPVPSRRLALLAVPVGFVSGILMGMIGTGGPPVVAYLHYRLATPLARRATLLCYFMVLDVTRLPGYLRLGIGSRAIFLTGLALVPFALLGALIGNYTHGRASERVVALTVALLLVLTGLLLLR